MAKTTLDIPFFAMQIIGKRDEQEDSYGICYDFERDKCLTPNCFVLADGMGGHSGGSVASQTAIDSVKLVVEGCDGFDDRTLRDALSAANDNIAECVRVNSDLEGMGTTLVVLIIIDGRAFWVSVGDSPLLCLDTSNELHLLNEDHSMRPVLDKMVESGVLTEDHPDYHKKVTQLRSALTGDNIDLYDLNTEGALLADSKYLLLSTDGLDSLSREEIKGVMLANESRGPKAIANQLIDAIDKKATKKQDNTTLIVIDSRVYKTA